MTSQGWDKVQVSELVQQLCNDFRQAKLDPADLAVLGYARKLTLAPKSITQEDVAAIKAYGYDDLAIHDLCAIVSYFAFVNRIADGLGVELEGQDK